MKVLKGNIRMFVNFDIDLHFQVHLLQELDDQTQRDYSAETMMKIA